jgi:hypothetical protein
MNITAPGIGSGIKYAIVDWKKALSIVSGANRIS